MKAKLLNVLTVCLVALVVVSPGLVVLGFVWEKHTEFVRTQKSIADVDKISAANMQSSVSAIQTTLPVDQGANPVISITETYKLAIIIQWVIVLIPVFVGLGIIIHDRYLVYRAAILREQVEMLERLWQQSIEQ